MATWHDFEESRNQGHRKECHRGLCARSRQIPKPDRPERMAPDQIALLEVQEFPLSFVSWDSFPRWPIRSPLLQIGMVVDDSNIAVRLLLCLKPCPRIALRGNRWQCPIFEIS